MVFPHAHPSTHRCQTLALLHFHGLAAKAVTVAEALCWDRDWQCIRLTLEECGAGIATSLKVLFSADDCSGNPANGPQLVLERNEVIALLNLLERLSNSIEVHAWLGRMLARQTFNALSYPALVFWHPLCVI